MLIDEFEAQTRDLIGIILNQLQEFTLPSGELQPEAAAIGASVQSLAILIEEFISQQRNH